MDFGEEQHWFRTSDDLLDAVLDSLWWVKGPLEEYTLHLRHIDACALSDLTAERAGHELLARIVTWGPVAVFPRLYGVPVEWHAPGCASDAPRGLYRDNILIRSFARRPRPREYRR